MSIETLVPYVAMHIPAVNSFTAELALKQAAQIFMRETGIFWATARLTGQDCVDEYLLDVPDCHEVVTVDVNNVMVDGHHVRCDRDGQYNVLKLHCAVREGACITVPYSWAVRQDTCEYPPELISTHSAALVQYALYILYDIHNMPWQSAAASAAAKAKYDDAVDTLIVRKQQRFSSKRLTMRNPFRRMRAR